MPDDHIISIALDDDINEKYRATEELSSYVRSRITNAYETFYVMLDEVQYAISRNEMRNPDVPIKLYGFLNGLLRLGNVDVYVTRNNSKMLSKDVMTEFRGRGDVVEISPLSFKEYFGYVGGDLSLIHISEPTRH